MSALVRLLYPPPATSRSAAPIIGWWERRRLQFNLVIGATGVLSLLAINFITLLPPNFSRASIPLGAVIVYAVAANMCYTAGWALELAFNAWWKDDPPPVGLAGFGWFLQLFRWLF
jgi:hypothetical protein